MNKVLAVISILFSILILFGCDMGLNEPSLDGVNGCITEEERYVENFLKVYDMFKDIQPETTTTGAASQAPQDYFNGLDIQDTNGNPVSFSEFSEEQKQYFLEYWKTARKEDLKKKINESPELLPYLKAQNNAIEASLSTQSKGAASISSFLESYNGQLAWELEAAKKDIDAAIDENAPQTRGYGDTSLAYLQSYYRWGNFFTNLSSATSSSSTSSINISGHAALLTEASVWNPLWTNNSYITVAAWGNHLNSWANGFEGVCYEPLGYWLGRIPVADGTREKVMSLYTPRNQIYVFDWFNSYYKYTYPTESERIKAKNYARSKIGRPYNWFPFDQTVTSAFYCSQLVWRSWNYVNSKYNIDGGLGICWWVTPADLMTSGDSKLVFRSYNY
ncbi:MAG: hypothetical protein JW969_06940 [Spirochaetales bacterium]|nr:hypothetical protein [Spirochaetales bacterium]